MGLNTSELTTKLYFSDIFFESIFHKTKTILQIQYGSIKPDCV